MLIVPFIAFKNTNSYVVTGFSDTSHLVLKEPPHSGQVMYFTPLLNQIGHISRIYLTTKHQNTISDKKFQKNPENPENIESG